MNSVYKIRKAFFIPFLAAVALLLALLILSLTAGAAWEKILVAVLFIISLMVAVESYERKFIFSENGISMRKFFRTKTFTWPEITHLGVVVLRNKAYFLLTTTRGFYVLSNLLQDHTLLIRSIADKLGDEKVEPEVRNYLEHPVERMSLVVLTWMAAIILVAIIVTKLI